MSKRTFFYDASQTIRPKVQYIHTIRDSRPVWWGWGVENRREGWVVNCWQEYTRTY